MIDLEDEDDDDEPEPYEYGWRTMRQAIARTRRRFFAAKRRGGRIHRYDDDGNLRTLFVRAPRR